MGWADAPEGYRRRMISGEFEAQYIGGRAAGLTPESAWRNAKTFLNQLDWLKALRAAQAELSLREDNLFRVGGQTVNVHMPIPRDVQHPAEFRWRTLGTRIRHLENISRINHRRFPEPPALHR